MNILFYFVLVSIPISIYSDTCINEPICEWNCEFFPCNSTCTLITPEPDCEVACNYHNHHCNDPVCEVECNTTQCPLIEDCPECTILCEEVHCTSVPQGGLCEMRCQPPIPHWDCRVHGCKQPVCTFDCVYPGCSDGNNLSIPIVLLLMIIINHIL